MNTITIRLTISKEQYLQFYQGAVRNVVAKSTAGQSVQFPANILQPFVTHNGINGLFELVFNDDNKFLDIHQL